ncbi:MAG: hypothetical protein IJM90_04730 [Firmicutes bacterium]|nr:hypothetical protein [Bacillota bacterium]
MADKIIEGVWDCVYCGSKKIPGRFRDCPNCGHPRDENITFYMADPNNYVEDPDKINKNPDWLCSFCNSLNSDSVEICPSCGASRQESEYNYFQNKEKDKEKEPAPEPTGRTRSGGKGFWIIALVMLGFFLLFGISAYLDSRPVELHVDELRWQQAVDVEVYKTVSESDWALPSGAHDVTESTEVYTYEPVLSHYETITEQVPVQVPDGYDTYTTYEDLGNGYFKEVVNQVPRYRTEYQTVTRTVPIYVQVPVYKTRYYYQIERWVTERTETTSGVNTEPYFETRALPENERYGSKYGLYTVIADGREYKVEYELWKQLKADSTFKVHLDSGWIVGLEE